MSETDSFIEEVTEEVRRDRLYALMRRYGWIPVLAILLIVGGAAFSEYRKAQARAAAQSLGDAIIAALGENEASARVTALSAIDGSGAGGQAVLNMLTAAEEVNAGDTDAAVDTLAAVSTNGDVPTIYRDIATFKALTLQVGSVPSDQLRVQFEALAQAGAPMRLLAEEQLALLDLSDGNATGAIDRLQRILLDAEASSVLQQRATQLIVALGGVPETRPDVSQG